MPSRAIQIGINIGVLVVCTVISVVLLEIAIRIFLPVYIPSDRVGFVLPEFIFQMSSFKRNRHETVRPPSEAVVGKAP